MHKILEVLISNPLDTRPIEYCHNVRLKVEILDYCDGQYSYDNELFNINLFLGKYNDELLLLDNDDNLMIAGTTNGF